MCAGAAKRPTAARRIPVQLTADQLTWRRRGVAGAQAAPEHQVWAAGDDADRVDLQAGHAPDGGQDVLFPRRLDLLRQVLREPLLPSDQFELLKRERIAGLYPNNEGTLAIKGREEGGTLVEIVLPLKMMGEEANEASA